ncbi:hypothetical protein BT63DRAFT_438700 [Microthyrium microscopicum]|uniref:Uncharacterized protein n=1 Tax=Microthyrium microscopicum TaxID=703497 RepID=A0A6A6UG02_9PEZI|nr:hypothetical protein BT63DRAFT_438700 [Microthyrium microscopicum]
MLFTKSVILAIVGFSAMAFAAPVENNSADIYESYDACQAGNNGHERSRCEQYRHERKQDRQEIRQDRNQIQDSRDRLNRDRNNGASDWRVNKDRSQLQAARQELRNDKKEYRHDTRKECQHIQGNNKPGFCN